MKHLRRIAVGLAIAATLITGISIGIDFSPQMDTTWGAPDTRDIPAADLPGDLPPITPLDTAWG